MADVLTMKRIFHDLYMSHGISFSWLGDYGISIPYAQQLLGIHNFPISLRGNNNHLQNVSALFTLVLIRISNFPIAFKTFPIG